MTIRTLIAWIAGALLVIFTVNGSFALLLDPGATSNGCSGSKNYTACYDEMVQHQAFGSGNTTRVLSTARVVPWMDSSTSCAQSNLQSGGNCNIGTPTFSGGYCVVSDEQSVAAINAAGSNNQTLFQQHYEFIRQTNASYGQLPAWKVLVNETAGTLRQCDSRTNSNCDVASDADARYILALYTAANNTQFTNATQTTLYQQLAANLSRDFVTNDLVYDCRNSTIFDGTICWWLAAGGGAQDGGLTGSYFTYTGYFGDAIDAMLKSCGQTRNVTYCHVAANLTLNVLEASKWNGSGFRAPPGKAFHWTNTTVITAPVPSCDNTCSPDQWDSVDAPRLYSLCLAQYHAVQMGWSLPNLTTYCAQWNSRHLTTYNSAPMQFYQNGSASAGPLGSFFAQGLQSQAMTYTNATNYTDTLRDAISHYTTTNNWDYTACFGVYNQGPVMRSLATGIGRDAASYANIATLVSGSSACENDYGNTDLNITADTTLCGNVCNIRNLYIQPGVTVSACAYDGTNTTGYARINATNIYNYGTITGDGRGFGGGSGAGGGGGADADGGGSGGSAGSSTNQNASDGGPGSSGGLTSGGPGGTGGLGANGTSTDAAANNDTTAAINATWGRGGAGGAGGNGGDKISGLPGGGGGGGGAGGDGGGYFIIIAKNQLTSTGSITARAGQNACAQATAGTSASGGNPGVGGNGAYNNETNCAHSSGLGGGYGQASGSSLDDGGTGYDGYKGAGGAIVLAAYDINLSGGTINVSGESAGTGGTIKVLFAHNVTANGTYSGYSSLVYSQLVDSWFSADTISWTQNVSSITQNWNTSILVQMNVTNGTSCNVTSYASNDSTITISSTGLINVTSNISKVGYYSVRISATDTCSNTISQTFPVNITYTAINLTSIQITPSPTGAASPLVCSVSLTNPDHATVTNTTRWYKNGAVQASLENQTTVGTGNLTLGNQWICAITITDTRTTIALTNSSILVLGDSTPPLIHSVSQSASSVAVQSESVTFSINTTDNEAIATVYAQITDPNTAVLNYTMSLSAGNLYVYTYTPNTAGNYGVTFWTIDGSNNKNTTGTFNFTATSTGGSTGGGGGGGGGGSTTVVYTSTAEYRTTPAAIDALKLIKTFDDNPVTLEVMVSTTKATGTCSTTGPFTCAVIENGAKVRISYTDTDHDFFSKTVSGTLSVKSTANDLSTTNVQLRLFNAGYTWGKETTTIAPSFFESFPYILRVQNGHIAGLRAIFIPALLVIVGGLIILSSLIKKVL